MLAEIITAPGETASFISFYLLKYNPDLTTYNGLKAGYKTSDYFPCQDQRANQRNE
jgi:hypothetical protein